MTLIAAWLDLDEAERRARLRCLQGLARVFCGPAGRDLVGRLRNAETDIEALAACDAALNGLGTIARRRILVTFAMTLPQPDAVGVLRGACRR